MLPSPGILTKALGRSPPRLSGALDPRSFGTRKGEHSKDDARELDLKSQNLQAAVAVNIGVTVLYWPLGKRIHLEGQRTSLYGEPIVATLWRQNRFLERETWKTPPLREL